MRRSRILSLLAVFVLSILVSFVFVPTVYAAGTTYIVSPFAPDGYINDTFCSLREAVQAAQSNSVIFDDCAAGSNLETDTIILESNQAYVLTAAGFDDSNVGGDIDYFGANAAPLDLVITTDGDAPAAIQQNLVGTRIFHAFLAGSEIRLHNLILNGGQASEGGVVRLDLSATVEMDEVTASGNVATGLGGAVAFVYTDSILRVKNSTLSGNTTAGYGSAIYSPSETDSPGDATVTIENTLIEGNIATLGGAVAAGRDNNLSIVNSTFVNNVSGPIASGSASDLQIGGGVVGSTVLTINNSTFTGGMVNNGANPSTAIIIENGADAFITNSIINPAGSAVACIDSALFAQATITASYNRVKAAGTPCDGSGGSAVLSANSLTDLGYSGGLTDTIMLRPGSNALNSGDAASCELEDARGVARRLGANLCDIGAVEMFRITLSIPGTTPESGVVNYTVAITPPLPTGQSIAAHIATQAGTATAAVDYIDSSQFVTFNSGTASAIFAVSHLPDDVDEPDESYSITVYQTYGWALLEGDFVGTISDDDTAGVSINQAPASVIEGALPQAIILALDSQPTADVSIVVQVSADDLDIVGGPGGGTAQFTITPAAWDSGLAFGIEAFEDQLDESNEIELVYFTVTSLDLNYNNYFLPPVNVIVNEANSDQIVNGGFEQDGVGGANANDKQALAWTANPAPSGFSRRSCKPSGDGSPCGWLFKGSAVVQSVKQFVSLPVYSIGDYLVLNGVARRANIAVGVSVKLQVKYNTGQSDSVKLKFSAGSDVVYTPFTRQMALNQPLADVTAASVTFTSTAASGKIYIDDISISVVPRFPRDSGGASLPPPSAPVGLRGMN